jgi:circadian clock protein KaiC
MTVDDDSIHRLERVPSGVPGLDAVTRGGFFRGGVYMVLARPGTGKTILGNQICFRHVATGGRAIVVTLLTESHSRMIAQLESLAFFDPAIIGASLSYVTGYKALEAEGLKGLLALLRDVVREHRATFLMIDGLVTAGSMAESEIELKKFVHELQAFVELVGCTTLLLTGTGLRGNQYPLQTMVDGLFELHLDSIGMEAARTIEVSKFRGSAVQLGRHLFEITDAGITIFPRTESRRSRPADRGDVAHAPGATFGVAGLDAMLDGGLSSSSITMVLGAPGGGKTVLGLSFLARGAKAKEEGLYFGFFETPQDIIRKGEALGLGLGQYVNHGLHVMWQSPLDFIADALAERLLSAVRERGVRRLFLDGLVGFTDTLVYPERSRRFFAALFNELRSLGVVTVLSDETRSPGELEVPEHGLMSLVDNVVFLRHVEKGRRIERLVSVMKMREGPNDDSVRQYAIGTRGFVVTHGPVATKKNRGRAKGASHKTR